MPPVDVKFVARHHFVEVTYNGILRRLLVLSVTGNVVSPEVAPPSSDSPARKQVFVISRATQVSFRPPGSAAAPSAKPRSPATTARGGAAGTSASPSRGDLPGYEQIGGLENQIEQIREMVEWPLTRPELYSHFGERFFFRVTSPED